jgi:two-component system, NtrC family, response regulator AtoC
MGSGEESVGTRRVLVVDDHEPSRRLMEAVLGPRALEVVSAATGREALARMEERPADAVLLDLGLPDADGMGVLREMRARWPRVPIIMVTAGADAESAVQAIRLGAYDYVTKPVDVERIGVLVPRAIERNSLLEEVEELRRRVGPEGDLETTMGRGDAVVRIVAQVAEVSGSPLTVLLLGETGTGKELVAKAIHRHSGRRDRPFVAVDCGAIPEALVESELFGHEKGAFTGAGEKRRGQFLLAEGGTLYLDEISNLPLPLQSKFLRVLETRRLRPVGGEEASPLDVRFVAATNRDLLSLVGAGKFREDLYFRIAEYTIGLPALRDRTADIEFLVHRFQEEASVDFRRPVREFTPEALGILKAHAWPGNVRELRNVVRRSVLTAGNLVVEAGDVRAQIAGTRDPPVSREAAQDGKEAQAPGGTLRQIGALAAAAAEETAIREALLRAGGNKALAARNLRTDYKTLHLKIRKYGIGAAGAG